MEEKSKQIQSYLQSKANPIIQPMLELMAKERPENILQWIQEYVNKKISKYLNQNLGEQSQNDHGSSQDDDFDEQEFQKKLERVRKSGTKKISRQAISSEVYGQFNQKAAFVAKIIQKPAETEVEILSLLRNSILFQNLNEIDMETVVKATELNEISEGQTVITEGQQGDALYVVSSGEYDCFKIINGSNIYLKTYKTGEAFGQLSLMYNAPRAATIVCKQQGVLYKLDRQTFRNIVQEAAMNKRSYYRKILSSVDILAEMDSYEKDQICDSLKQQQFGADQYVVRQGDTGDKFYIIAEGELVAEKSQDNGPVHKVFDYHAGEYFGEIALMKNTVRQASVKTVTPCRLVWIDRSTFKRLLGPLDGILGRNMEKYRKIVNE